MPKTVQGDIVVKDLPGADPEDPRVLVHMGGDLWCERTTADQYRCVPLERLEADLHGTRTVTGMSITPTNATDPGATQAFWASDAVDNGICPTCGRRVDK